MKLAAFVVVTTLLAFRNIIRCSEILEFNRHIRPFLLNQHPIFITNGKVSLADRNLQTFHAEQISSVLAYDFKKLLIDYANPTYLRGNITGRHHSLFIWTRFPSFIHIFPNDTNKEVYGCQYRFLHNSGLSLKFHPKIISVIITQEHSAVHERSDMDPSRSFKNNPLVETLVDYYDFALYFKPKDTKSFNFKLLEISSASILKFCTDPFFAPKVSLVHFESCKKSPFNGQNINSSNIGNCITNTLQIVSETNLNLSRFGIELTAHDFRGHPTYGGCLSHRISKNDIKFSNNFRDISVQNILLEELVIGLPVSFNCVQKEKRDLIILRLRFSPEGSTPMIKDWDIQVPSSLLNHEEFNFITCDGVRQKNDFMGYLEPFDAQTWLGIITSLLIYTSAIAMLVSRSPNTSFMNSYLSSLFMNLSYLTGVANVPLKVMGNFRLNTIRMLMFSWGIATIVLCCVYSSLVTSNVIAPKTLVSPWTEYKQLEKFTKVFGLNNHAEKLRMDGYSKADKSDLISRYRFAFGSKVSMLWFVEMRNKQFAKYEQKGGCDVLSGNSSTCEADRKKTFKFLDSYRYAVRSDVQKLKEILSVCTHTALIDRENAIDGFLHIWNQDEHVPPMVKGTSFFQQSYTWTMSHTWVLRKLLSFRLTAFTATGIIGFWERFCLKHCKKPPEFSELQSPPIIFKTNTFKPQKLQSNMSTLFFILLIAFALSILCFLGERCFFITSECFILFLSYRTDINVRQFNQFIINTSNSCIRLFNKFPV
jgi:hypothetical protein